MKKTELPGSPLRTIRSLGTANRGRQQPSNSLALQFVEGRQQIELFDQSTGVETDVEARPPFGSPGVGDAALQVVIDLAIDKPFLKQISDSAPAPAAWPIGGQA